MIDWFRRLFGRKPAYSSVVHANNDSEWDDRAKALEEFPVEEYERLNCSDSDEARSFIAMRAFEAGHMVFGQARWFGPGDGMVFIKKEPHS